MWILTCAVEKGLNSVNWPIFKLNFEGKLFQAELDELQELYSFKLTSVNNQPYFYIKFDNGEERNLRPEDIGAGD